MGGTRKFLMAVVALGCAVGCSSSQWEQSWSPKEQEESQKKKNNGVEGCCPTRINDLDGFAVGFLILLIFWGGGVIKKKKIFVLIKDKAKPYQQHHPGGG